MPDSFSQEELIQSVDILKVTIPRMNNLPVPLTPDNYAVWYEYSQGTTLSLNHEIDDLLNNGKAFTRDINKHLYDTYILKYDNDNIVEMQAATKVVIESLVDKIQGMTDGTQRFGGALSECKKLLAGEPDINQLTAIVSRVLEETSVINDSSQQLIENLNAMEKEVSDLHSQMSDLAEAAHKDSLTRVANRRACELRLNDLFDSFKRQGSIFSVVLIDIDHFKQFNDTHGHAVGDKVLTYVASSLKSGIPEGAMVARYGGEEFLLLLPSIDYASALSLADMIRAKVAKRKLTSGKGIEDMGVVTISAGVSTVAPNDDLKSLVDRADQAMYRAKHTGRNLVCGELDLCES